MSFRELNVRNKALTGKDANNMLKRLKISKKAKTLGAYQRALTDPSYTYYRKKNDFEKEGVVPLQAVGNDRMEQLGANVLMLVVTEYLFERYPRQDADFLARIRSRIMDPPTLASMCQQAKISPWVLISNTLENNGGRENHEVLSKAAKALLGVIHLDLGFEQARKAAFALMERVVDFSELVQSNANHKEVLKRYFESRGWGTPYYEIENQKGKAENLDFTVFVYGPEDKVLGEGVGLTRPRAEHAAAKRALANLMETDADVF